MSDGLIITGSATGDPASLQDIAGEYIFVQTLLIVFIAFRD